MSERVDLYFDLGDTLVDLRGMLLTMAAEVRSRIPALAQSSMVISLAWARVTSEWTAKAQGPAFRSGAEIAGLALQRALSDAGESLDLEEAIRAVQRAWSEYVPTARFHEDVTPVMLDTIRRQANVMGIVTDSDSAMVEPLLRKLDIRRLFDVVLVSDRVGTYKPDPRIYRAALDEGNSDAASSIFVSDSPTDLEGARAVGMGTVWIRRGRKGPPVGSGRDWVVGFAGEIVQLLTPRFRK